MTIIDTTILSERNVLQYSYPRKAMYKFYDFYCLELLNSLVNRPSGDNNTDTLNAFNAARNVLREDVQNAFTTVTDNIFAEMLSYLQRETVLEFENFSAFSDLENNCLSYEDIEALVRKSKTKKDALVKLNRKITSNCKLLKMPRVNYIRLCKYINGYMRTNYFTTSPEDGSDVTGKDIAQLMFEARQQILPKGLTYTDIVYGFNAPVWRYGYGGKPWAKATAMYVEMDDKKNNLSLKQKAFYIDRIYDLQHNTGSLLDKNDVLHVRKEHLNWRARVKNINQYIKSAEIWDDNKDSLVAVEGRVTPQVKQLIMRYNNLYTAVANKDNMNKNKLNELVNECITEVLVEGIDMQSVMDLQRLINNPPVKWANKNYPGGIAAYKKMLQMKIARAKKVAESLTESTPPEFPETLKKKLLRRYSAKPQKAYQTMWALHNKYGEKLTERWMGW